MKIIEFKMNESGIISVTVQPTTGKTSLEVDMPMTVNLEQALVTEITAAIRGLLSEKSDLTAAMPRA